MSENNAINFTRPLGFVHPPRSTGERYNKLGPVLRASFGEQIAKISLDGGYTCPNRDGTLASGGCTYCGEGSRGMIPRTGSITRQFQESISFRKEKKYIAYFQSYTGTYAPIHVLRPQWSEAISQPGVCGLAISTRPDCLENDVVAYLASLAQEIPIWIELGLESPYDSTLKKINRGHTVRCFEQAMFKLAEAGIATVAHLIFGLPQDPPDSGLKAIDLINQLPVWGLKIHPFHVVKNAPIALAWKKGNVSLISRPEYIGLVTKAISRLRPDITIHRVTGSGAGPKHLAPDWGVQTKKIMADIEADLKKNGLIQGMTYMQPT